MEDGYGCKVTPQSSTIPDLRGHTALLVSTTCSGNKKEAENFQLEIEQVRKPEPLYSSSISTTQGSTTNGTTTITPSRSRHQKSKSRKSPYLYDDANLGCLRSDVVDPCLFEMNSFPLHHAAFSSVTHSPYTEIGGPNPPPPPQYPHSPHVAMGLLDPAGGNFLPHYPHQRLSPLPHVETAYDREERYSVQSYASFPPCEASVMSSSPDVETDPMQPMTCVMPPQQELCSAAIGYVPPNAPQTHEMSVNHHILYSAPTVNGGPFSSPSDSMLSESDLDSFQNGRTDSPRSTSSTSSPLHHQHSNSKPPSSALGPVLRGGNSNSSGNNHYKSVITATNLQRPADFINSRLTKQQQFQQRTYASCSPSDNSYNDSCYFEVARQQQQQQSHLDSGIKYALSKCDNFVDKSYCISSSNGANDYACTTDPGGVQPQYTSVIVDAQQYQMANGFVH
ncbi:single-minded-like protein [Trichonephila inaurata madagascariensis]|uniref:Single-minded-like protein n=1 Tax=Trichonephila inaurata madagascariensis TaxID=2747483 RepID=A0A8X7CBE0_9ARAC|nr:single-minded-like protein [Trichonephila inaurata madagascariensis]